MTKEKLFPDYLFETSWEVCNKIGGIYTVLSSRARTLQSVLPYRLFFIGPDVWHDHESPYFKEDSTLLPEWRCKAAGEGLTIRLGRWLIPGEPIVILVDFRPFFERKNEIYSRLWEDFQVDSLHAYGDYDESSMFAYAAGRVVESFYNNFLLDGESGRSGFKVIFHANEWMTGLGLLYIRKHVPRIATIFTTHATSIGRSIAGNRKPLYDYLFAYDGDQMAYELNMQSKHSIEKQTAHHCDCFTTVSKITSRECTELLDKTPDILLPNGFDDSFVPRQPLFNRKRAIARRKLLLVAHALTGDIFDDDTLIISTSGRYEFRNKGIDVYIEAMNRLLRVPILKKKILAFVDVPGWVGEPRKDLIERMNDEERKMKSGQPQQPLPPLDVPLVTHWLHNMGQDNVLDMLKYYDMHNRKDDQVKVIFLPCYLDGRDGVINLTYYDTVLGNDLCVYPSYYEPWGYTPLEAIAFHVPCITSDLAGFGCWVNGELGHEGKIEDGVQVIHRTDYNYSEVADTIKDTVTAFSLLGRRAVARCRHNAHELSARAHWSEFIKYYYQAYDFALRNEIKRNIN